jgi:hypothetical protein
MYIDASVKYKIIFIGDTQYFFDLGLPISGVPVDDGQTYYPQIVQIWSVTDFSEYYMIVRNLNDGSVSSNKSAVIFYITT